MPNLKNALKIIQAGLPSATTAGKTQTAMLFNQDGTPANKIPLSTDAFIDLKTGKKLSDILEYNKPYIDTELYVDMGLPSGVLWAKRNIDVTQADGFTASEFQYDCSFFSFGNTDGHNPTANSSFSPWTWGSTNDEEPYVSSPGAAITYPGSAGPSLDAARANIGVPWRLPTTGEFKELYDNCDFVDANGNVVTAATSVAGTNDDKRVTVNGIVGLRFRSKINGNILFFPASGYGAGSSRNNRGSYGLYWSSSLFSAANGRNLYFNASGVYPQDNYCRYRGYAVRPVQ